MGLIHLNSGLLNSQVLEFRGDARRRRCFLSALIAGKSAISVATDSSLVLYLILGARRGGGRGRDRGGLYTTQNCRFLLNITVKTIAWAACGSSKHELYSATVGRYFT